MIPYEELVIALQTWRARQGLPVGQLSGAMTPPPVQASPPPPPPPPAQEFGSYDDQAYDDQSMPPPLEPVEDSVDLDAAALDALDAGGLIEEHAYEEGGGDFAMSFQPPGEPAVEVPDDEGSTSIGEPPEPRPSESTFDEAPPPGPNRNDDW